MWTQQYDPMGYWPLSTLLAALPVLVLLGLLASGRVAAWQAALCGLLTAARVAAGPFGMPVDLVVASAGVGVVFAVFRIVWLIVAAVFLYDIAVTTGQFEVMKAVDRQALGRSAAPGGPGGLLVRGVHRGGGRVRSAGGHLGGLPGRPGVPAVPGGLALPDRQHGTGGLGGASGMPIETLSAVTDLDVEALSATCGRILPLLSVVIPFWLVRTMAGWRETLAVWPALLVIGGTFAAVAVPLVELRRLRAGGHRLGRREPGGRAWSLLRFWKPREDWRFDHEAEVTDGGQRPRQASPRPRQVTLTPGGSPGPGLPFALLTLTVLVLGEPAISRGNPAARTGSTHDVVEDRKCRGCT